jgi:hypothetical protein
MRLSLAYEMQRPTVAVCGSDGKAARELAAKSLRTFFGPDRPYLKDQTHLYEQLVESWGGGARADYPAVAPAACGRGHPVGVET